MVPECRSLGAAVNAEKPPLARSRRPVDAVDRARVPRRVPRIGPGASCSGRRRGSELESKVSKSRRAERQRARKVEKQQRRLAERLRS